MESNFKSVSIQELQEGNKRLCLSALRVFGKCHECEVMKRYFKDRDRTESKGIKPCESVKINPLYFELEEKKKELNKQLSKIHEEIKNIDCKEV